MPEQVGVLDYYGARQIRDRDIDVVVASYFADPANTLHVMADDVLVDVAQAIKASAYAKLMLASDDASEDQKRQAVWNANDMINDINTFDHDEIVRFAKLYKAK